VGERCEGGKTLQGLRVGGEEPLGFARKMSWNLGFVGMVYDWIWNRKWIWF